MAPSRCVAVNEAMAAPAVVMKFLRFIGMLSSG
jgi:hypothetical protein